MCVPPSHNFRANSSGEPTPWCDDEQIKQFNREGYTVKRNAFDADSIQLIDRWADELLAMPEMHACHWVYWETSRKEPGRKIVSRIEKTSPFHDGFRLLTEVLKAPVRQLLGEEAMLFKEKLNFKFPGGDGFKPHQDSQAGWDAYADFFVSALVSLDEATPENGCLQIVGNYRHRGLFRSWQPLSEEDMAGMELVDLPTKPGDVVFFDSFVPHASQPNRTDRPRRIFYATYNRKSAGDHMARYYADKHKTYPPDIDRRAGETYVFRV